ncbi:MAG TPA: accessory gene regulator B family protein [Lachnospiraceae bacterium]|nr:accessory gene regulator B family protein [Lachnospiraceae bacterium]
MINRISNYIADKLILNSIISKQDKNVYKYGLETLIVIGFNILSVFIIGYIFGMLVECIVFLIVLIPLRSFAGGYHTSNYTKCFIFSFFVLGVAIESIKLGVLRYHHIILILLVFSCVIIWLFAPLPDANKEMSNEELTKNKFKTKVILGLECLIFIATWQYNKGMAYFIACAIITTGVSFGLYFIKRKLIAG